MAGVALIVIAKAPVPGRVKTRLCPPLGFEQAAALAEAALFDTLAVASRVRRSGGGRRVLAFDGPGGDRFAPAGGEVVAQRGLGLAERLDAAFADVGGPALLVGMDTPQLTAELLLDGIAALSRPGVDAVLGPARDGGYWSIGLARAVAGVFDGVPMSRRSTCAAQRRRLAELGLSVHEQPVLRDVDTFADAVAVARCAPRSRFALALGGVLDAEPRRAVGARA